MAEKKIPIGLNPPEAELETRVEAMMEPVKINVIHHDDTNNSDEKPSAPPVSTSQIKVQDKLPKSDVETAKPTPIDIFNDPKTAPEVPEGLLDKLALSGKTISEPPVVPAGVANKVPQLIASTAPKPKPVVVKPPEATNPADAVELSTPDAAPVFSTEESDALEDVESAVKVPPLHLDDAKTEAAIAAISASESDELLAAQDALKEQPVPERSHVKPATKSNDLLKRPWFYIIIVLLLVLAVAAIPFTRYKVAGLVVKQTLEVKVVDSKTQRPVSKAVVTIDGHDLTADANGLVSDKLPVGNHKLSVSKQYYAATTSDQLVDFSKPSPLTIILVATGRQVPITITDKLTGKPVANAEISVLTTNAKTDSTGKALIVLPTKTKTINGKISSKGFNDSVVTIEITDSEVPGNSFALSPAGKIYFLSNDKGTVDVVKSNLDGTERQTVIKGTGKEDPNSTVLLASRDWQYSVLKAQRDSSQAALYLIDSSTDKLVEFDSGDANFTPIGWYGHSFMYDAVRNTVATSQNSHELLKSYDAERGQLNQLDATQANGDGAVYTYQGFYNFNIVDNVLVYNTQWFSSGGADIGSKTATIRGVQPNGQNKKDYQTIPGAGLGYVQAAVAKPQDIYFSAYNFNDSKTTFYEYQNQNAKVSTTITQASFNKLYPTYVLSPSGKRTAWSEIRNSKHVVVTGDAMGDNAAAVPNLTGFTAYGWYSDDYLLVTKNNGEIYIVASAGTNPPVKITDYFKPAQSMTGTGYGYGGL